MWCDSHTKRIPFVGGLGYNYHMNTAEEIKSYIANLVDHYRLGVEHAYTDEQYLRMKAKLELIIEINERVK